MKNNNTTKETLTINLTAYSLPRKTEAWCKCQCCGDYGIPQGTPGKFSEGTGFPVTHEYKGTVTVFKDAEQVKSYVTRAINLLGNHPQNGTGAEMDEWLDFWKLFPALLEDRNQDFNQLLHIVHEFEDMLRILFGNRPEIHDDAVVWAFAYIMYLLCDVGPHDTAYLIHEYWDNAMFDSAERARGIRDAVKA